MKFGAGTFQYSEHTYPSIGEGVSPAQEASLGLPQWGVSEWKGTFYPQKTAAARFLSEYAKRLDCVEVSSTFYSDVPVETYEKWREQVPSHFRFLPKWPQEITHHHLLKNCERQIIDFAEKVQSLKGLLGTTFLQLPPSFSVDYKMDLFRFLQLCPETLPLCIEFRHPSWFEDGQVYGKLKEYLSQHNRGMVCSDTAARRDIFHLSFTGSINIIRYLSDSVRETDQKRLKWWREWLKTHGEGRSFFFVFHQPDNQSTPELIHHFSPEKAQFIEEQLSGPQATLF